MNSPLTAAKAKYSFLYFCKLPDIDKNLLDLADYLGALTAQDGIVIGFDRTLWAAISSGQMPSQLYTFNFYGSSNGCEVDENILVVISEIELRDLPEYIDTQTIKLNELTLNDGVMAESFEEDDEFVNCFYASLLIWNSLDDTQTVEGVQNICFDMRIQLLLGNSLYAQDEWVDRFFNDSEFNHKNKLSSAVHLLLPCTEKIAALKEAVLDKERIHLDPEIKGIYC